MSAQDAAVEVLEREQVEEFLRTCIGMTKAEETRKALFDPSSGRPGANLVAMQAKVWKDLGVSSDAGRHAVTGIEAMFPDDHAALVELRSEFARGVDAAYLQCLEDRRPAELETKAKMQRQNVLEFLDACNLKLDLPEVHQRMRKHIQETGGLPEAIVNEVHDEAMELAGFEKTHGHKCFRDLGTKNTFKDDREVAITFGRWRGKSTEVCFRLLNEFRKEGGELKVDEDVRAKLMELQAKEELDSMTFEERSAMLEKNARKVNVFRKLPPEGRKRYLATMTDEQKLELAKSEIMMVTLVQSAQDQAAKAGK